jgi:3D (Asp-Asp-Asp) domain-containing protein
VRKAAIILSALLALVFAASATPAQRWYITAYCLRGTTYTGTQAGWGTIAVDPRVIPLGSRLWVQGYGYGRALDTGGAVKGNHVDVWMASCRQAWNATRYGQVRILGR